MTGVEKLSTAWERLQTQFVFVVSEQYPDKPSFFVEAPDVHDEDCDCEYDDFALLRVFQTKEEGERYRETVLAYDSPEVPLVVVPIKLSTLMSNLLTDLDDIQEDYQAMLRVDLNEMPAGCHPAYVDTIFCNLIVHH